LTDSIFTDRLLEKNQFYAKNNRIGSIELKDWHPAHRRSFEVPQEALDQLGVKGEERLKVALQAIANYSKAHWLHLLSYSVSPAGFGLYFNGRRRLFPLALRGQQQPVLADLVANLSPFMAGC
jgi:hypothetical protein